MPRISKTRAIVLIAAALIAATVVTFRSFRRNNDLVNGNAQPPSETPAGKKPRARPDLADIFTFRDPGTASYPDRTGEYVLLATGDVLPARSVNTVVSRIGDFTHPYRKTAGFLKKSDILFINLETPLVGGCAPTDEGMIFCGDTRHVEGLVHAGVDVANLANNHMGNHGRAGLDSTVAVLGRNGIAVTGTGSPVIKTVRGKKFGFLGFNDIGYREDGISWADIPTVRSAVKDLSEKADFVIVAFHWGVEYVTDPDSRQRELAHAAVDSGADLVIGNHPHWVQAVEFYRDGFISYAHGNFVFDQMWSRETTEGVVGRYVFDEAGLKEIAFYPVVIEDYSQPRFASRSEAEAILGRMDASSLRLMEVPGK